MTHTFYICPYVCVRGIDLPCTKYSWMHSGAFNVLLLPLSATLSVCNTVCLQHCLPATLPVCNTVCLQHYLPATLPVCNTAGTRWMNWAMVGACIGGLLLILPVAEQRHRWAVDVDTAE